MLRHFALMLFLVACATLASRGTSASDLPALRCGTVRAPGATCAWVAGGPCTWEEGGTPTVCAPVSGATIQLRTAGTYRGGYNNASAAGAVAFDAKTRRLFVANGATQAIDVVDLGGSAVDAERPRRLTMVCSIDVANPGLPPAPGGYTPFHVTLGKTESSPSCFRIPRTRRGRAAWRSMMPETIVTRRPRA